MNNSYEYPNSIYSTQPMLIKKKKKKKKEKGISFFKLENYQLLIISFGMNYYLKELSQVNILWTVL